MNPHDNDCICNFFIWPKTLIMYSILPGEDREDPAIGRVPIGEPRFSGPNLIPLTHLIIQIN